MSSIARDISDFSEEIQEKIENLSELYQNYCQETESDIQQMKLTHLSKEYTLLQKISHNVIGVSASLHLHAMEKISRQLNTAIKANAIEQLPMLMVELERTYLETKSSIISLFGSHGRLII